MREEILSRCGDTRYCLRLWSVLNPEKDFDKFTKQLVMEEVERQLNTNKNLYRFSLSHKDISGLLSTGDTWKRLYDILAKEVERMNENKLLDLILDREMKDAVEL